MFRPKEFFELKAAAKHSRVFRPRNFSNQGRSKTLRDPGSSPATLVADAEELNAEEPDEDILEACADQAEGPRFESKLYLWSTPKNLLSIHRLKLYL